ncbi:MAG: hypothetical protein WCX17_03750 [Parcubacteria group bacterium]|jgi:hypothetical protein
MPRRSKSLDKYPEGRLFVLDFGDSADLGDRVHEQMMIGGGYYVEKTLFDTDSIPAGELSSPEAALIAFEEKRTEMWQQFRKVKRSWQIAMGLSCSGKPKVKPKLEREFRTPLSESERRDFIRSIPLVPIR